MALRVRFTAPLGMAQVSSHPARRSIRAALGAVVIALAVTVLAVPGTAHASTLSATAYCAKISAATVSSDVGIKATLLGASLLPGTANDVCYFGKVVGKTTEGVSLNYNSKGTGTAALGMTKISKETGVVNLKDKQYPSVGGGTTYYGTWTLVDNLLKTRSNLSGMFTFNGSTQIGAVAWKVFPESTMVKLLQLAVNAA